MSSQCVTATHPPRFWHLGIARGRIPALPAMSGCRPTSVRLSEGSFVQCSPSDQLVWMKQVECGGGGACAKHSLAFLLDDSVQRLSRELAHRVQAILDRHDEELRTQLLTGMYPSGNLPPDQRIWPNNAAIRQYYATDTNPMDVNAVHLMLENRGRRAFVWTGAPSTHVCERVIRVGSCCNDGDDGAGDWLHLLYYADAATSRGHWLALEPTHDRTITQQLDRALSSGGGTAGDGRGGASGAGGRVGGRGGVRGGGSGSGRGGVTGGGSGSGSGGGDGSSSGRLGGGAGAAGSSGSGAGAVDHLNDASPIHEDIDGFISFYQASQAPRACLFREKSLVSFQMRIGSSVNDFQRDQFESTLQNHLGHQQNLAGRGCPAPVDFEVVRVEAEAIGDGATLVTISLAVKAYANLLALMQQVSKLHHDDFSGYHIESISAPTDEWLDYAADNPLSAHDGGDSPTDGASRWARFANRLLEWDTTLPPGVRTQLEGLTTSKFEWGSHRICRCPGCAKWLEGDPFLYVEKLERAVPWYENGAAAANADPSGPLAEPTLLACARDHWCSFFGPLQNLMAKIGMDVPVTRDNLPPIPDSLRSETGGLNQLAYATAAFLNDIRRQRPSLLPPELHELVHECRGEVKLSLDYRLNFEGTEEDNYCLGCRPSGCKWYVGVSRDEPRRHRQHHGTERSNSGHYLGAHYIGSLTAKLPCAAGGWVLTDNSQNPEEAFRVYRDGPYDATEEDRRTREMAFKHGLHHVRGGVHVQLELSPAALFTLQLEYRAKHKLCSLCGRGGHYASACTGFRGQRLPDDAALMDFVQLRGPGGEPSAEDDRRDGAHAVVARQIARSVCECLQVSRLVAVSEPMTQSPPSPPESGSGQSSTDDRRKYEHLVRQLYGEQLELRPLQHECLNHVADNTRPDIVLTAPTSYGKTLMYLTAAVYEVLYGAGKAVIFLPFSALMSELAHALAEITEEQCSPVYRREGRIITHEADPRVEGTSLPYGGRLLVQDQEGQSREISWTIWRGFSGDPIMREHVKSDVFRRADIILAIPDKWMWVDARHSCDSFLSALPLQDQLQSRREWLRSLGLVIIDEAHEVQGVLGGSVSELLRRMVRLRELASDEQVEQHMRVMLVSATIEDPEAFYRKLLQSDACPFPSAVPQPARLCQLVKAPASARPEIRVLPEDLADGDPEGGASMADSAEGLINWLQDSDRGPSTRQRLMLLVDGAITVDVLVKKILQPEVLRGGEGDEPADVRRVLIFIDSKAMCAEAIKALRRRDFAQEWRELADRTVKATPYHGDVPTRDRRLSEKSMGEFARSGTVHFIVATSALEAGEDISHSHICWPPCDGISILSARPQASTFEERMR